MEEDLQLVMEVAKENMDKSISFLKSEFSKLRAGKADPAVLDGIKVDYYGVMTPLNQVANINTPDPRTIAIQPWEKPMAEKIEKAILAANIGLTPMNNGEIVRLNIPILTEERRKELVKQVKKEGENAKIGIRNSRRDANEEIKKLEKAGLSEDIAKDNEGEIQKMHDKYISDIDKMIEEKEKDIMTI